VLDCGIGSWVDTTTGTLRRHVGGAHWVDLTSEGKGRGFVKTPRMGVADRLLHILTILAEGDILSVAAHSVRTSSLSGPSPASVARKAIDELPKREKFRISRS
jgi:hypothetical protein